MLLLLLLLLKDIILHKRIHGRNHCKMGEPENRQIFKANHAIHKDPYDDR